MTFGAGFLMRPLGRIVLGAYIDQHGRRAGLLLTLGLMAVGIVIDRLACRAMRRSAILAPMLVVVGRLVQGFSAGVELGGVSVYLSEIATPGHKGFYVSWQSGSQQIAVMFVALLGVVLSTIAPAGLDGHMGLARAVPHRLPDHSVSIPSCAARCRRPTSSSKRRAARTVRAR